LGAESSIDKNRVEEYSIESAHAHAHAREEYVKITYGELSNVYLTESERLSLTERYGSSESESLINNFSRRIKSKGYHYEDHYAALLDWAARDGLKPASEKSYDTEEFFSAALMRANEGL
jgi:hypothetical protein